MFGVASQITDRALSHVNLLVIALSDGMLIFSFILTQENIYHLNRTTYHNSNSLSVIR